MTRGWTEASPLCGFRVRRHDYSKDFIFREQYSTTDDSGRGEDRRSGRLEAFGVAVLRRLLEAAARASFSVFCWQHWSLVSLWEDVRERSGKIFLVQVFLSFCNMVGDTH